MYVNIFFVEFTLNGEKTPVPRFYPQTTLRAIHKLSSVLFFANQFFNRPDGIHFGCLERHRKYPETYHNNLPLRKFSDFQVFLNFQ